jgi:DNA-3-methyladenine glycosylase II
MEARDIDAAIRHLRRDAWLAPYIRKLPKPVFVRKGSQKSPDPFYALAESIVYQQLSGKAALSIFTRFKKLFRGGKPTPKTLLRLSDDRMRSAGLSRGKIVYLRDLASKFLDGTINPKLFDQQTDEEIRAHLVAVKGIGVWTADMFLMFYLNRLDVLPTGDLAIRKGFKKLFNLRFDPDHKKMVKLAESWRPYRTVACRYLWDMQDMKLPE